MFALSAPVWLQFKRGLLATLQSFHAANPDLSPASASSGCACSYNRACRRQHFSVLQGLVRAKDIVLEGAWVRLSGHEVRLTPADEKIWQKNRAAPWRRRAIRLPRVRDIATLLTQREADVRRLLKLLGRMGKADEVAQDHFFLRETVAEMVAIVVDLGATAAFLEYAAARSSST